MQIKREGEPTFVPVVITLESDFELKALINAVHSGFDNCPSDSTEEDILRELLEYLQTL